ncbi:Carboxypeptidase regulatory-like domain [Rubrobacter radiotolerans]|uniref:Carboxypeptidase regulatory-like domain n=1 Tax=Rubrobacter radiotolerans TaxID=42256 RepID=A0A023X6S9_RUBRA|nr:carboxypeptidase-like regulatory domain-containing protein [Rubrobacter radiotolerans]AHY47926.1 Carboxypeptidase regulatory-like domain [Rubrobacter radiotolerans]MDX5892565.1 carboxypeptidase-like regulatory domain-containing protein [Rubrobacter radiotolerans]SMC07854.1 nickel transport protein [Rubrobacter radiotolerans DSM 5868]
MLSRSAADTQRARRAEVPFGASLLGLAALAGTLLVLGLAASPALAHGVELEERTGEAVEITATFDNGEPMREAQVTIYAPKEPQTPWATGVTDEEGRYAFLPDGEQPGEWSVQVRQAGHGTTTSVEVTEDEAVIGTERTSSAGRSPLQTGLMAALGLWGFIGTALFFLRRRG